MDIEELHKVVVQGFASVNDRIDSVETRLTSRVDTVEARLTSRIDTVEARLTSRIDSVEGKMDTEFGRVKDALLEHGRQLKDIRSALDRKVDRDELEARH